MTKTDNKSILCPVVSLVDNKALDNKALFSGKLCTIYRIFAFYGLS